MSYVSARWYHSFSFSNLALLASGNFPAGVCICNCWRGKPASPARKQKYCSMPIRLEMSVLASSKLDIRVIISKVTAFKLFR